LHLATCNWHLLGRPNSNTTAAQLKEHCLDFVTRSPAEVRQAVMAP
jgi:hypothetical protein